jgi:2-polyprenyl-3-methyl-5-hydroxy-6-metoxy-1,4-benzoquinol methylase
MTADYDKIAKQYKASKRLPFREYIEWYSYNKMLGDVSQKSVLDLACGEGFYSRRIKRKGADKVVGVDISEKMIRLAKRQEQNHPLGIDYILGDVMELGSIGNFDLVVASYLLNYANLFPSVRNMDSPKVFPDRSKKGRPLHMNSSGEAKNSALIIFI